MIDSDILIRAVQQEIITADQAAKLRALEDNREPHELRPSPDDEQLRLITGFSDIFVTIGLALFLGAVGYITSTFSSTMMGWLSVAATAWLLAEYFTRIRRMALPSIVLLLVFTTSVFVAATWTTDHALATRSIMWNFIGWRLFGDGSVAVAALAGVVGAAIHYWRFRVPITIAAGAAALVLALISAQYQLEPRLSFTYFTVKIFACGIAVFALAMYFDMSDRDRQTRRTDIAFWLHLLAAPLIVHPILQNFLASGLLDRVTALSIIGVFLMLGVVAVLIDRRALLVSGLAYAGYAVSGLMRVAGFSDMTTPLTLLALGSFVLLLSAGWTPFRRAIIRLTPSVVSNRLPPASA